MTLALGCCSTRALLGAQRRHRPVACNRLLVFCRITAGKGFGGESRANDDEGGRRKQKAKRVNIRREETPIPGQGIMRDPMAASPSFAAEQNLELQMQKAEEDEEFAKRLAVVRLEGEVRRRDALDTSKQTATTDAAFDIYANPPSISDTLLTQLNSEVSDPKLKNAQIGPNQLAVAIGAVLLGLMFVLVSGADFATSKRYKGVRPAQNPPDGIEASIIKGRIAQLENARQMDPADSASLEELAVSYAQLLEYEKSAKLLDKLVAVQPKNLEAWRLLGETTLLAQQPARSLAAYEKAVALSSSDIQVLTGLADASIASGQQSKAIDYFTTFKAAKAAPSLVAEPADAGSGAASVDTSSLDLLLAKVYSSWRGHDNDALAVYDGLIKGAPEDFRGYLAKGLFLKEHGRKSDAERMFMQARFYAPESRQAFIKQMAGAGSNPVLDLPGDD